MKFYFDHEKLNVYQKSLDFVEWSDLILKEIKLKIDVLDHLDRASSSIVLNIAEGNGKFTSKDRCKYFDISRGSSLECAGCLDILYRKKLLSDDYLNEGKRMLHEIVSMLVGLIKSNSDRVYDNETDYGFQ